MKTDSRPRWGESRATAAGYGLQLLGSTASMVVVVAVFVGPEDIGIISTRSP